MSSRKKTQRTTPATSSPSPEKFTEERVLGLLSEKHDDREWAFFSHLRNGTGLLSDDRTFDAYAINTWPSKKHLRIAYEVKVSKADFMREVNSPYKRASAMDASNQYYFVAPRGMLEAREIPENCGLIEVDAGGLKTRVAARHREIKAPDLQFICSLLRASSLKPTGLKLFKYAGQELNQEGLLALLEEKREWAGQHEINTKVAAQIAGWKKGQPEQLLADAVMLAMGKYSVPTVEEFKDWMKAIQVGVPIERLKYLKYSADQFHESLSKFLERLHAEDGVKPEVPAHDKPAGPPGAPGSQGPDPAPGDPPATGP